MVRGDMLMARAGRPWPSHRSSHRRERGAAAGRGGAWRCSATRGRASISAGTGGAARTSKAHVLLGDTSRSRLLVYAKRPRPPAYVTDFYTAWQERRGEIAEGDQKTPLGVLSHHFGRE